MNGPPIYALCAWSGTGKTTYLERLIPLLTARGVRVGVIKHDGHDFEPDHPGKDSWRYARSGAAVTVVASATTAAVVEYRPLDPWALYERVRDVDLILAEGFKTGPWPKICLARGESPMAVEPGGCVAIVADRPTDAPCPVFPLDDPEALAQWLVEKERLQ